MILHAKITYELAAVMENASLRTDVWNSVTTSSSEGEDLTASIPFIRDFAATVAHCIIGTVGIIDNLFVIVVFVFFVKIADKVIPRRF